MAALKPKTTNHHLLVQVLEVGAGVGGADAGAGAAKAGTYTLLLLHWRCSPRPARHPSIGTRQTNHHRLILVLVFGADGDLVEPKNKQTNHHLPVPVLVFGADAGGMLKLRHTINESVPDVAGASTWC